MQSSLYRDSRTKYGKFKRNHNQSLLVSITESLFVEDASDCSFSCVGDPKCLSYNIAKSPDSNGIYVCEVLATDMYRAKDRLKANSSFHHFSPMSPCENWPCKNSGKCIPDFKQNDHLCNCTPDFTGKHCDTFADYAFEFSRKGTSDYIIITSSMPSLTAVAVCLWMKTADTDNEGAQLSYAVPGTHNELTLWNYKKLGLSVGGRRSSSSVSANDGKWHHICVTWENNAGSWKLFKDGSVAASGTSLKTGHVIRGGGALVLGQEQDSVGGSFQSFQSFIGEMTGVNIWNHVILDQEIARMSQSCLTGVGNVFQWHDFKAHVKGSVKIIKPSC
ncbi:neuronal pentraxin-2-like [Pocillopora verrucosa]|uniref:neuronal pentraxin-2-like n=1 Tax=Pocillopora verrucosa TaxID=203993 RepID=UPI0033401F89